jgi:hypothetical protein
MNASALRVARVPLTRTSMTSSGVMSSRIGTVATRRAVTDQGLETALREQGKEVAGAVRKVEEDHRVVRQVAQRDSRMPGEPVMPGEQDIGRGRADVRGNQVLFEVVAVREGDLAFAGPQRPFELGVLGFEHMHADGGVRLAETGEDPGKPERGQRREAAHGEVADQCLARVGGGAGEFWLWARKARSSRDAAVMLPYSTAAAK